MAGEWQRRLLIAGLGCLPRLALSRLAGRIAARRLPPALQRFEILAFGRLVGVDFGEVRDPIESFASLQDFFTRALKDGARPLDPDPAALVAPCDGFWGESGAVERGTLLQVKGRPYSLASLLADEGDARSFEGGSYATFYLSPRDYHRFHAPCDACVVRAVYVPGTLWPVNRAGLGAILELFARNERIGAFMDVAATQSSPTLCMVAVGATLVGKVRLRFDDLTTNACGTDVIRRPYPPPGHCLAKGEEWGRFEFGSTIVMITSPGVIELDARSPGSALRLGQRIGTLRVHPLRSHRSA